MHTRLLNSWNSIHFKYDTKFESSDLNNCPRRRSFVGYHFRKSSNYKVHRRFPRKEMETASNTSGNGLKERNTNIEAGLVSWIYPEQSPEILPPPAVPPSRMSPPAMTSLSNGPILLTGPSASTPQESQSLVRSTTSGEGNTSTRSVMIEDLPHAPPIPEASTERSSTPSAVSQYTQIKTSDESTKSVEFVTVLVPLTRLPESIVKSANPHIALPLALPQLHSSYFPESASEPSNFEAALPHSQPVELSIMERGNLTHHSVLNDLSHLIEATPKTQSMHVDMPTESSQNKFESATPVPHGRLSESSHSKKTSIHKDILPAPSRTTPHQSKAPKQQVVRKILPSQPKRSSKKRYKHPLCVFCGKVFTRYDTFFKDHLRGHIHEVPFECPDCGKGFSKQRSYNLHLQVFCRVRKKEKCHSCHVCQKTFRTKCNLKMHLTIHSSQRTIYRCSRCPATFKSKVGWLSHEKVKHEGEQYKCEECGELYNQPSSLRLHMRRHRQIKAHSCLFCNKAFYTNQELFRHLRFHTQEERKWGEHSCTFCGRMLISLNRLYNHLCWHIHEKWHSCAYCGNQFASKKGALNHIRQYHKHE